MAYKIATTTLAAGLVAAAAPAQAQDASGFRLEGRLAWEQASADLTLTDPEDEDEVPGAGDDRGGLAYGIELGYDRQLGTRLLLGAYAGADLSGGSLCGELAGDDLACTGLDRTFTLGARAGVLLNSAIMLYAKGGYASGKFTTTYDDDVDDNDDDEPGAIEEFSGSRGGYHFGGGIEWGVVPGVYAKVEYVHTRFGSGTHVLGDGEDEDPVLGTSASRHQVAAGLGLKF